MLLNCANCSKVNASPRTDAGNSISSNACATCSLEKFKPPKFLIPFWRVFLLWLKDARINWNNYFSFVTLIGASLYFVRRMTADPTFGLGIKQFGGTFATTYGSA